MVGRRAWGRIGRLAARSRCREFAAAGRRKGNPDVPAESDEGASPAAAAAHRIGPAPTRDARMRRRRVRRRPLAGLGLHHLLPLRGLGRLGELDGWLRGVGAASSPRPGAAKETQPLRSARPQLPRRGKHLLRGVGARGAPLRGAFRSAHHAGAVHGQLGRGCRDFDAAPRLEATGRPLARAARDPRRAPGRSARSGSGPSPDGASNTGCHAEARAAPAIGRVGVPPQPFARPAGAR